MTSAAADATAPHLSPSTVCERNALVAKRIAGSGMRPVDVKGDGNCFFRSVSVSLTGLESDHSRLRKKIIQYMIDDSGVVNSTSASAAKAHLLLENLMRDGVWVGEDVIRATSSCLGRDVRVYSAMGQNSALVYPPACGAAVASAAPIQVAFYEPGHYMAVMSALTSPNFNSSVVPDRPMPADNVFAAGGTPALASTSSASSCSLSPDASPFVPTSTVFEAGPPYRY